MSSELEAPHRLLLLRHGESVWNEQGLFTGWVDIGLSERGVQEAIHAGELLAASGLLPDVVHTSVLARAIRTTELALEVAGREWIPVRRSWRLNERHYGDLQGKSKEQTRLEYGDEQFMLWRRSYDVPPPSLPPSSDGAANHDPRYAGVAPDVLPASECLKDVLVRVLPYWYDAIAPELFERRLVLVSAQGTHCALSSNTSTGSRTVRSPSSIFRPASRSSTSSTPGCGPWSGSTRGSA